MSIPQALYENGLSDVQAAHNLDKFNMSVPVLICDDSISSREGLARLCREVGVSAEVAANGKEGVEMCRTTVYGLVVLDDVMPIYMGLEAAALIRALPAPFNTPSLVLLTTKPPGHFSSAELFLAGIDDIIRKPINVPAMRALFTRGTT